MSSENKSEIKSNMHPRNKNRERYDIHALIETTPALKEFVKPNKYGADSIDFADPKAVKLLNQALLKHHYHINFWDFPEDHLIPPIPGRADYLHYVADLLASYNQDNIPVGPRITGLDIGVGASLIYPMIGASEYQWRFIGSDISDVSLASAQHIIDQNDILKGPIELRLQEDSNYILNNILGPNEKVDFTLSNPPFHATIAEAKKGIRRKVMNLTGKKTINPSQNFAGIPKELVYEGGEYAFIKNLINESKNFAQNCFWFTTLISKQDNVAKIRRMLEQSSVTDLRTIRMGTSNKSTRIMAWTFLTKQEQEDWVNERWS